MKKYQTKIIALSAAFLLLLQLIPICRADVAYTDADIKKAVEETLAWRRAASGESENGYLFRGDFLSAAGNSGADWYAVAGEDSDLPTITRRIFPLSDQMLRCATVPPAS